jgi:hypothetical protein
MAMVVVDPLQFVHVHHQHARLIALPIRLQQGVAQAIQKQGAVGQAGEQIMGCLVEERIPAATGGEVHGRGKQIRHELHDFDLAGAESRLPGRQYLEDAHVLDVVTQGHHGHGAQADLMTGGQIDPRVAFDIVTGQGRPAAQAQAGKAVFRINASADLCSAVPAVPPDTPVSGPSMQSPLRRRRRR